MRRSFEDLLAEGAAVPVAGWDFSWFDGRATEERTPWGYAGLLADRLATARASLDLQTGGGEVYAFALRDPPSGRRCGDRVVAAEPARSPAHPRGLAGTGGRGSRGRRPAVRRRRLRPGEQPAPDRPALGRAAARRAVDGARAAGLDVVELREAATRVEFFDVAAVVHFLRKVVWTVPDFTVEGYRGRLRALHEVIERDGWFVAYSQRYLIEARRPVPRTTWSATKVLRPEGGF